MSLKISDSEIKHRVETFVKNLEVFVEDLVKCVIKKGKGLPAQRIGLTSMSAFVSIFM